MRRTLESRKYSRRNPNSRGKKERREEERKGSLCDVVHFEQSSRGGPGKETMTEGKYRYEGREYYVGDRGVLRRIYRVNVNIPINF